MASFLGFTSQNGSGTPVVDCQPEDAPEFVAFNHNKQHLISPTLFHSLAEGAEIPDSSSCCVCLDWNFAFSLSGIHDLHQPITVTAARSFSSMGFVWTRCEGRKGGAFRPSQRVHISVTELCLHEGLSRLLCIFHMHRNVGVRVCLREWRGLFCFQKCVILFIHIYSFQERHYISKQRRGKTTPNTNVSLRLINGSFLWW